MNFWEQLRYERRRYISPACCEGSQRTRAVVMSFDDYEKPPRWRLRVDSDHSTFGHYDSALAKDEYDWYVSQNPSKFVPAPTHCPFCGTKLPDIVKKAIAPQPLCRIDDYGEGCDTCKEERIDCVCWPPEAAYEAVTEGDTPVRVTTKA